MRLVRKVACHRFRFVPRGRQRSSECQHPGKTVSRALAFIPPTSGIHDAVDTRFNGGVSGCY
jgi:hypothetical protein